MLELSKDEPVDAILYADGAEIARHRADSLEPTDPTGSAGFESFSVEWSGGLGEYTFELVQTVSKRHTISL